MQGIPTLDLGTYRRGDAALRARFAGDLCDALRAVGFVTLEGHGIDPALVRRVYGHFERFFSGPEGEKLACSGVAGGQRGFTPYGVEHAKGARLPDAKEFYHVGQPLPDEPGFEDTRFADEICGYPRNVWPAGDPGFRRDALEMFRALETCSIALLHALEEGFGLPPGTLADMPRGGNSILRALHYPPIESGALAAAEGVVRAAAHEDINLVTLLCEASDAGLEILAGPGGGDGEQRSWVPIEVEPGQIVADSGDMLSRITNDVIPSTTHRVVNPPASGNGHRYSMPFFAHPRPSCDLSVLEQFVSGDRPRAYPPITAGAFLKQRLEEIGLLGEAPAAPTTERAGGGA